MNDQRVVGSPFQILCVEFQGEQASTQLDCCKQRAKPAVFQRCGRTSWDNWSAVHPFYCNASRRRFWEDKQRQEQHQNSSSFVTEVVAVVKKLFKHDGERLNLFSGWRRNFDWIPARRDLQPWHAGLGGSRQCQLEIPQICVVILKFHVKSEGFFVLFCCYVGAMVVVVVISAWNDGLCDVLSNLLIVWRAVSFVSPFISTSSYFILSAPP